MPKAKNKASYVDKIIENELRERGRSPADIRTQIDQIELDIQQIVADIRNKKGQIRRIDSNYKLQLQVEEENRLKDVEYENLRRQQNDELLNDFNRLNMGRTQLFREPDETEEDFYLRLVAMGNVEADPADIEKQIQTDILLKAKKNILEITNEESKAETVIKMLNNDERFQMNKFFPKIKKTYSDTFGINNKNINARRVTSLGNKNRRNYFLEKAASGIFKKAEAIINKFQLSDYNGPVLKKGWTAKQVQGVINPGDIVKQDNDKDRGVWYFYRLAKVDTKVKNV